MSFNIIVKTLNGKQLPLAIESSWTTQQIKEAIEKEHAMPAETLKLIAYGKVLQDTLQKEKDGPTVDGTAETYNLKEGDFVVAMTQKAKPKPKAPVAAPVEVPVAAPVEAPVAAPATAPVAAPVQAPVVVPQPVPAAVTELPPLTDDQKTMLTMVKELTQCNDDIGERALRAVNFIPDTAYELITTAPHQIPTVAQLLEAANHVGGGDAGGDQYGEEDDYGQEGAGGAGAGGQPGGELDLSTMGLSAEVQTQIHALMANPSFPMIRQRMQQDQNFATQFLAQLAQTQPQIAQAIQQNPQLLFALVLGHNPMAGMAGAGGAGGMPGAAGGGQQQPPPGSIQVSPQEMEDINMLVSYGFPKQRAAEAYLACDKNIEQAANFLFEAGADDDDTAMQQAMLASQQEAANPQPAATQPPAEGGAQPDNNNNNNEGGAGGDAGAGGDTGAGAGGDAGDAGAGGSSLA